MGPKPSPTTYFLEDWYGAAGVNIAIPIFNGFKYHSEATPKPTSAPAPLMNGAVP